MALFVTRIELHKLPKDRTERERIYKELREGLYQSGFVKTIVKGNTELDLPRATYALDDDDFISAYAVDGWAIRAIEMVWDRFTTLTVKVESFDDIEWDKRGI